MVNFTKIMAGKLFEMTLNYYEYMTGVEIQMSSSYPFKNISFLSSSRFLFTLFIF